MGIAFIFISLVCLITGISLIIIYGPPVNKRKILKYAAIPVILVGFWLVVTGIIFVVNKINMSNRESYSELYEKNNELIDEDSKLAKENYKLIDENSELAKENYKLKEENESLKRENEHLNEQMAYREKMYEENEFVFDYGRKQLEKELQEEVPGVVESYLRNKYSIDEYENFSLDDTFSNMSVDKPFILEVKIKDPSKSNGVESFELYAREGYDIDEDTYAFLYHRNELCEDWSKFTDDITKDNKYVYIEDKKLESISISSYEDYNKFSDLFYRMPREVRFDKWMKYCDEKAYGFDLEFKNLNKDDFETVGVLKDEVKRNIVLEIKHIIDEFPYKNMQLWIPATKDSQGTLGTYVKKFDDGYVDRLIKNLAINYYDNLINNKK